MIYLVYNLFKQHNSYHYNLRNDKLEEISINSDIKNWQIGDFVDVEGSGKSQSINKVKPPHNYLAYFRQGKHDSSWLKNELNRYVSEITNPDYLTLITTLISDNQLFFTYPAAKQIHHAYIGGLCEHTLNMLSLAQPYIKQYHLNKDLLYTGIIFHDYGKIYEYSNYGLSFSMEGQLLGHIVICDEHISLCQHYFNLDKKAITALKHLVLSHHGEVSYGSPKPPLMKEAVILHVLDDTDAQINIIDQSLGGINDYYFSSPVAVLDRRKFMRYPNEEER